MLQVMARGFVPMGLMRFVPELQLLLLPEESVEVAIEVSNLGTANFSILQGYTCIASHLFVAVVKHTPLNMMTGLHLHYASTHNQGCTMQSNPITASHAHTQTIALAFTDAHTYLCTHSASPLFTPVTHSCWPPLLHLPLQTLPHQRN